MGSASVTSEEVWARGRLFNTASTFTTMVWRLAKVVWVWPNIFFKVDLVKAMSLSQKPSNQGACFGMKRHSTLLLQRFFLNAADESNFCSSPAAAKYVVALSDSINYGDWWSTRKPVRNTPCSAPLLLPNRLLWTQCKWIDKCRLCAHLPCHAHKVLQ